MCKLSDAYDAVKAAEAKGTLFTGDREAVIYGGIPIGCMRSIDTGRPKTATRQPS